MAQANHRVTVVEGPSRDHASVSLAEGRAEIAQRVVDAIGRKNGSPPGIFVASDDLMAVIYHRLRQEGIEPGRDAVLIGCNRDVPYLEQLHPRPATIDIRLDLVGERAVDQLMWRMSHPIDEGQTDVLIKPVVVPAEARG